MISTFQFLHPKILQPEIPYIKVISPNGGEKWIAGNTYDIKWESKGIDKVFITLLDDENTDSCELTYEKRISAMESKYSYKIVEGRCPLFISNKMKIAVKSWDNQMIIGDESDNYFSIVK